jgi:hypothetical protein
MTVSSLPAAPAVVLLIGFCVSGFDFAGFWATAGLLYPDQLTVLWQVAKPVATSSSVSRIVAENDLPLDQFPEQGAPRIKEVVT